MRELLFSPAARRDLLAIAEYVSRQASPETASRFVEQLIELCEKLGRFPNRTRKRPELGENLRSKPIGNYVIILRPNEKIVEIVRILHSRRRITPEMML